MPDQVNCPQCEQPLTQVGSFWICPQHGQVSLERPFVPIRVFLSYGHDEHVSLVLRLREDLDVRGHQVWFDEQRLSPGHDWELHIEKGLKWLADDKANSAVVLLLTPHSVRRPDGYCLNEVAWALGRGLRIIPLMVVESEPPLSICRIQWLDMRECIPISEKEPLYVPKFERLLRALEDGQVDFEGTQSRLLSVLEPIQFSADILKLLRDFTGREWVFDEVDGWLNDASGSKVFWITGAPGVGKSALAAWVREHRREIAAFHFCDINSEEKRNPAKLVRSVVYQLSTQLPEYEARLGRLPLETIVQEYHEAYTLFDKLLVQPLAENFPQPDRTVVVLIDALDEATHQRQNEIVRFLTLCASKTPTWLRFLVTSRPEPEIVASFGALSPYVLDTAKPENLQDLRAFLRAHLPGVTGKQTDAILERSEGVFLYVRHVVEAVQAGDLNLERLDEFPRGLGDVYQQFFQRQFGGDLGYYEEKITPLVQVILAAFEPLTFGLIQGLCDITTDTELGRRLNRLGALFPTSGETETDTIRPFHRSLCDWITSREASGHYVIAAADGHRTLAECGWEQFEQGPESMEDYFLQWLPAHLLALAEDQRLVRLLQDFRYLMEKARRGMLEQLLADFRELPPRLASSRDGLQIVAEFFREKAHILRRGNDEWPAHKILLQLAVEHADDSPLTLGAEEWLAEGRCNWFWLRRVPRLLHTPRSRCLAVLEGHASGVTGALPLADGRLLSWCGDLFSADRTLRLWDGNSGACLAVLEGHTSGVLGALALVDGRLLSWSWDYTLRLWDGNSGVCLKVLEGHTGRILGVLELADKRLLSWGSWGDNTLRLWDCKSGACLAVLEGHTGEVSGALALADGRLLSWSDDKTLRLWDGDNGACLAVLEGHTGEVSGALALADGRLLSWSDDKTLRLWDCNSGACLAVLEGHTRWVRGALALGDGRLVSWSWDKTLRLWDGDNGACLAVLEGHTGRVDGALPLADGRLLSWSWDKTLRLWDGIKSACLAVLPGHTDRILGAIALPDGRLLSWSQDSTLRLWGSGERLAVLEGHASGVLGALILADGQLLSWSQDKTLRLWGGNEGLSMAVLEGHTGWVDGALALADGRLLTWSWDKTLRMWDGNSGVCLVVLEGHTGGIWGALALADGRLLSWSQDKTLRTWDGNSGVCLAVLEGHTARVDGALALADGRLLSWSQDTTLRLWNGTSGACLAVLEGHTDSVDGALALADGRLLSWGSWGDDTFRLWDSSTGTCMEVVAEDQVAGHHPQWLHARKNAQKTRPVVMGFFASSAARMAHLRRKSTSALLAAWAADSDSDVRCLLSDGTVVVTQRSGQVCILKLHHAHSRISLGETEAILPTTRTESA
jgi:WD40 repeat protein